jgi:hypothetical protein
MGRALGGLLALIALGLGCTKPPGGIYYASGKGAVTPDGLHRVDWEPFQVTYVKPGADLQRYDKVLVREVTVSYKTPSRMGGTSYALPPTALEAMKRYFHDAFVRALSASPDFSVASAPGPDVLLVGGHIVDLTIRVPPQADQAPDEDVYTSSPGRLTLVLDARDSVSGEPLVRVGQTREVELGDAGWYESDPVTNSAAIRELFREWAEALRRELDQFHALPSLPSAPS